MRIIVAHAAWIPERRQSLVRLLEQLKENVVVSASQGPEHASIWARRGWEWAAAQDEHVLILNDDVIVHPELRTICEAMIEAVPAECLSLHTNILGAAGAELVGHHWCRCYMYTGPAVILPPARVRSLLAWTYRAPWSFLSRNNEDVVAIHWAWSEQRPFYAALPAPVIHDTTVRSTLGYDDHPLRVPTVPWSAAEFAGAKLTEAAWWRVQAPPPAIDNSWMPTSQLEYVRRLFAAGAQLCASCSAREGLVAVGRDAPRLCFTCATRLYQGAVRAAQEPESR